MAGAAGTPPVGGAPFRLNRHCAPSSRVMTVASSGVSHDDLVVVFLSDLVDDAEEESETRDCERLRRSRRLALADRVALSPPASFAGAALAGWAYRQSFPLRQFPAFQYRQTSGLLGAGDWDREEMVLWSVL